MQISLVLGLVLATLTAPRAGAIQTGKIGIFDLDAIRSVPLDAAVTNHTEADGVATDEIRFTAMPGIRAFAYMSYPVGGRSLPTNVQVRNFGAETRRAEGASGFVGFSACAPQANQDPNAKLTLGGAKATEAFTDDPQKSWVYQHVVIQLRALDYLATRPEVDMTRVVVSGFSWSGFVSALLHALDNRPCAYVTWNSTGYFADVNGNSGDKPSRVTRKQYEMYCPSNYAQYGTQPIFIGNSITDYFATLDGAIEMYRKLQCPKQFVWAPNRYHADTSRKEYDAGGPWVWQYQGKGAKSPTVKEGAVEVRNGKLLYKYYIDYADAPTRTEVLYSYGGPGHWIGRTWHRMPATLQGTDGYVAEIPVYDPSVPIYIAGQIEVKSPLDPTKSEAAGNCPQLFLPKEGGVTQPSATYPTMLMDFEDQSDLYFGNGLPEFLSDGAPQGQYYASVEPFEDGTTHLMNIEPFLWPATATELHFFLKGDGKPGPVNLFLVRDSDYYLDKDRPSMWSEINIVKANQTFADGWHEFMIPLSKIGI